VFRVIAGPYLGSTPRALADKLEVTERGTDMVLVAHHTPIRWGLKATTLETVHFDPPESIHFRLVRGPVPYVVEDFVLHESEGITLLQYRGELGADLWAVGRWWGGIVQHHPRSSQINVGTFLPPRSSRRLRLKFPTTGCDATVFAQKRVDCPRST
jgi:hypothetical protein